MCSICGLIDFHNALENKDLKVINMGKTLKHRGMDDDGVFCFNNGAFQHNRLAVMDVENGKQPMSLTYASKKYTIVYNGEIYNCNELKRELAEHGILEPTAILRLCFIHTSFSKKNALKN